MMTVSVYQSSVKVAVTLLLPSMVIEAGLVVPLKSPDQLSKLQPPIGTAVNWTTSP